MRCPKCGANVEITEFQALILETRVLRVHMHSLQQELNHLLQRRDRLERKKLTKEAAMLVREIARDIDEYDLRLRFLETYGRHPEGDQLEVFREHLEMIRE